MRKYIILFCTKYILAPIYEDEHVLDNIYKIKNFKKLEWICIWSLKVNEDIKAMFPNAEVFID